MNSLKRSLTIGLLVALTGVAGCASLPNDLVTNDGVDVVKTDSQNAHVASVQISVLDEQHIKVSGYLTKRYEQVGRIPGRLHIEAVGYDGEIIADLDSDYRRRKVHSRHAFFSQELQVPVDRLQVVKVTHYGLGTAGH